MAARCNAKEVISDTNKEVVDVADATLCATTLLFGIPPFYETPVLLLRR